MPLIPQISPRDAYIHLQNGSLLLDVRESDEVQRLSCDVSEALYIPMNEFQNNFFKLPKDKEIITICHSGGRSSVVTQFLITHGYTQAFNISGGIIAWQDEKLPVK